MPRISNGKFDSSKSVKCALFQMPSAAFRRKEIKMSAFALLEWEDKYVSTIDALTIIHPRKEIDKYVEGEYITARFKGKPYKAVIAELNDDRKILEEKKRKGILKFRYTYKEIQNEDPQDIPNKSNTTNTSSNLKDTPSESSTTSSKSKTLEGSNNNTNPVSQGESSDSNNNNSEYEENINDTSLDSELEEDNMENSVDDQSVIEMSENDADTTTCSNDDEDQPTSAPASCSRNIFSSLNLKKISVLPSDSKSVGKRRSIEDTVRDMQNDIKRLKKKVNQLEKQDKELHTSTCIIKYNGLTIDDLKDHIKHSEFQGQAVNILLKKMFSSEEILNNSISGKKSSKSSATGPRPAMDQEKLNVLFDVLRWKFPNFTRKETVEKIQNIQKVMRRIEKKDLIV